MTKTTAKAKGTATVDVGERKAKVWADRHMSCYERQAEVERLWHEFDRQRNELEGASLGYPQREAGEDHASPRQSPGQRSHPIFARRRRPPYWK
jgi:hypothetical protein